MSKKEEITREQLAKEFITEDKEVFKKFFPRDKIVDVTVTECVEKKGAFAVTGSVGTLSPREKEKTFKFNATVVVDEEGECALTGLQVSEI